MNEVPGNEATFRDAPVNQATGDQTAGSDALAERAPPTHTPAAHTIAPSHSVAVGAGRAALALLAAIMAWLVPGLGHLLLGRWGRALLFFAAVGGLVVTGYLLRGNVFAPHSGDPFGTVGFLADAGTGVFYYFSRFFESAGPDVSRAAGDYGTRFIAAAGVVNVLAVLDVIEIATGRRS